jgi:hypothetical protein
MKLLLLLFHLFVKKEAKHLLTPYRIYIGFIFIVISSKIYGQDTVISVNPPVGGFRINGTLKVTTSAGDWVKGTGIGDSVFKADGNLIYPNYLAHPTLNAKLIRDRYNDNLDTIFSGSAFSDNPNTWKWAVGKATNKCDINNGMYLVTATTTNKWMILGGDRYTTTGTSYIDFEFLQGTLTRNSSSSNPANPNGFTYVPPTDSSLFGGRVRGDFVLSMEYSNGGTNATVHYYRWELSSGAYKYVEHAIPPGAAVGATNGDSTDVPFGGFGVFKYIPFAFVEAAVNVDAIVGSNCQSLSIKTLFIKTKASDSYNAALKDFVAPQPVNFHFGVETMQYPSSGFCKSQGTTTPSFSGTGTFSATHLDGSVANDLVWTNLSTGVIDLANSAAGTYIINYQFNSGGGCPGLQKDTITINANPSAPAANGAEACAQNPVQTLTATATAPAGGSIEWYDAATGGSIISSPTLNAVGTITYYAEAIASTGCRSLTRTAATLTIKAAPAAPSITGGSECEQNPIQTLTATATAPSGGSIVWYNAATSGSVVANPTLNSVGTATFYAEAVGSNGCHSLSRTPATLTIKAAPAAPSANGASECEQNPIQTLTATATAPSGGSIVWYSAATSGSVVANPTLNSVGTATFYAEAVGSNGCHSLSRTAAILTIKGAAAAPSANGANACQQNPLQTLTATATAPAGGSIVWYDAATAGSVVANPTLNSVGTVTFYAEAVGSNGCHSLSRTSAVLTIKGAPAAPSVNGAVECKQNPTQTLTATATAPSGGSIIWYTASTGGSVVANPTLNSLGTITYYAEAVGSNGCHSFTRSSATLTIKDVPTAPAVSITEPSLCGSSTATLTVSNPTAGTYTLTQNAGGINPPSQTYPSPNATISFSGLLPGKGYNITVNSNGCASTTSSCAPPDGLTSKIVSSVSELSSERLAVKAYPNPFSDKVKFVVTAPVAGRGHLEVYNMMGQKVKTVYQGFIAVGTQTFELSLPTQQIANLVYVLRIGDKKISGKILQIN